MARKEDEHERQHHQHQRVVVLGVERREADEEAQHELLVDAQGRWSALAPTSSQRHAPRSCAYAQPPLRTGPQSFAFGGVIRRPGRAAARLLEDHVHVGFLSAAAALAIHALRNASLSSGGLALRNAFHAAASVSWRLIRPWLCASCSGFHTPTPA